MHAILTQISTAVHRGIYGRDIYPEALKSFLPEIRAFSEYNHFNILHPILRYANALFFYSQFQRHSRLLAQGMELPEETFVKMHTFDAAGEGWCKYLSL